MRPRRLHVLPGHPEAAQPRQRDLLCDDEQPLIDPAYLTDAQDVDMLVDVVGVTRDLAASEAFREWLRPLRPLVDVRQRHP